VNDKQPIPDLLPTCQSRLARMEQRISALEQESAEARRSKPGWWQLLAIGITVCTVVTAALGSFFSAKSSAESANLAIGRVEADRKAEDARLALEQTEDRRAIGDLQSRFADIKAATQALDERTRAMDRKLDHLLDQQTRQP
jgi:hypothetical protein